MQTAALAGSIAASEATQRLCEGYFEFRALGPTAVKGLNAPIEVYEVVRVAPLRTHFQLSTRRGLTRFVGREREMAAMAVLWRKSPTRVRLWNIDRLLLVWLYRLYRRSWTRTSSSSRRP
jgi:hypothetical protein